MTDNSGVRPPRPHLLRAPARAPRAARASNDSQHPSRLGPREREAFGLDGSTLAPRVDAPAAAGGPDEPRSVAPHAVAAVAAETAPVAAPPTVPVEAAPSALALQPGRRTRLALTVLAVGIATSGILMGTHAAWTASSANPGNSVAAGTLTMSNDKDATSVFAASNVAPGDAGSSAVTVANTGSLPLSVGLLQDTISATGIEASLNLKIHDDTRNSGGGGWCYWPNTGAGACATYAAWDASGTLAPLTLPNSAGGARWAAAESHTFTISWTLLGSSPNSDQGKTGSFRLVWSGAQ